MPELFMELKTSLGNKLFLHSMSGHEEVSRLFEYEVVAGSEDAAVSADNFLGSNAGVSLKLEEGKRWFNGVVTSFGVSMPLGRFSGYRFMLRPWLWLATRSANLKVFQNQTVPDIVREVLRVYPGTVKLQLKKTYEPRVYCVQYRESDFNFVSRLMEEEGIFYFFAHADGKHDLVLADDASAFQPFSGFAEVPFDDDPEHYTGHPAITDWQMRHEIQPAKFVLRDFNFITPSTDLTTHVGQSLHTKGGSAGEVYDYPGGYEQKGAGDKITDLRLAEAESRYARFSGSGNTPGLVVGAKFKLTQHWRLDQITDYVVLSTRIELSAAQLEAGGGEMRFGCGFTAQKYAEPFRPARITRKPHVAGPQTAIVTGQGNPGDIHTDDKGRVKVQFHWDRLGNKDATSSCWLRVASPMAGNGWGFITIPRIGQEVVVDFLEGDPDRPFVSGRVHNGEQLPPYPLPDNATVTTFKSRSKGGESDKFNELRFEDKPGSEYVLMQAQKDRLEFVEETLKSTIGKEEHRHTKEDRKEQIEGQWHMHVTKDVLQKFDAKFGLTVAKDVMIKTDAKFNLKTAQDIAMESGTAASLKTSTDLHLKIGKNIGAEGGMNVHIKGGMNVVIEAGTQLTLKGGSGSVVLGMDGVAITGPMVKINSGGSPGSGSGASPVAPTEPAAPVDPTKPTDPLSHR